MFAGSTYVYFVMHVFPESRSNWLFSVQDGKSALHLAMSKDHMYTAGLLVLASHSLEYLALQVCSYLTLNLTELSMHCVQNLSRLLRWACERRLSAVAAKIGELKDRVSNHGILTYCRIFI